MKKSIINLGSSLNKEELKNVFGGANITKLDPNCDIAGACCGPDFPCTRYVYGWEDMSGTVHYGGSDIILQNGSCVGGSCYY